MKPLSLNSGATLTDAGTHFRTWAPFANWVSVVGSFNHWDQTVHRLQPVGCGQWELFVAEANSGDEYRFVLDDPGHYRIDPWARTVTSSAGNAVITDPAYPWSGQHPGMPGWHELVIYELHFGSFLRHHEKKEDWFDAAAALLDDLVDLGVNAIEIMPMGEFQGDDSWGYNPSNIFAVESTYGGPRAFKRFIERAHAAGLIVLLDVVYNHFGGTDLQHSVWRYDRWYENAGGGIYFYNDWRANTHGAGVGEWNRPDYGRPEVREYFVKNAEMWLNEFRLDGLRLDLTSYIRNVEGRDDDPPDHPRNLDGNGWRLLREINDMARAAAPWKLIAAEDMRNNAAITRPTDQGGAGFGSQWHPDFHHVIRRVMCAYQDADRDLVELQKVIEWRFNNNAFQRVIYTENHDEVGDVHGHPDKGQRVPKDIDHNDPEGYFAQKRSTLGAAVLFASPGIPMIFAGQEMLEIQQFTGAGSIDWTRRQRFAGIVQLYRDLIRLRRNLAGRTGGLRGHNTRVTHRNDVSKVLAIVRSEQGGPRDHVLVIANWSNQAFYGYRVGVPRPGLWRVRFNSDSTNYSPLFDNHQSFDTQAEAIPRDEFDWSISIGIGRYSAVYLSQDD